MYGILQPLHELLEVCDSRLLRPKTILSGIDAGRAVRLISRVGVGPNPADPRDQPIKLTRHRRPGRLGETGRRG
jgi:hypothetical protein